MYYQKTCAYCGKAFTAQKSSTQYCSKLCNDRAYKEKMRKWTQSVIEMKESKEAKAREGPPREILSPRDLAIYLDVGLRTAYRYLENGLLPCISTKGKTFVRKSDIEKLFDSAPPYQKRPIHTGSQPKVKQTDAIRPLAQADVLYTTAKEVAEKYDLSPAGADKILKESGIIVIKRRGKHYYYVSEVEALFRKRNSQSHPEITEWYTSMDVQQKFNLRPATVYDIVSTYQIPSKKVHNVTYYSKIHFDMVRGIKPPASELWYTVHEAMEKYNQTRDQVYNVLRYNNIQRVQIGRNVKFRRTDYDDAMKFVIASNNK